MNSDNYRLTVLKPTVPEITINIEKLYSTYAFFYAKNYSYAGEYHDFWEVVYVDNGEVIIKTPDYETILTKGQVFIHTPNEKHKIRANNTICNVYNISFKCDCEMLYKIARRPISIPDLLKDYIIKIVDEGQSYLAGKNYIPIFSKETSNYSGGQLTKNLIEVLLIELIRQNSGKLTENKSSASTNSIIAYIINYMNDNINKKLTVDEIAANIGYSSSYIGAIFKKATGVSIINYFINLRVEKAKKLIMEEKMAIWQISEYLNYESMQYFSMQFKKITKLTPSQYVSFIKAQRCLVDKSLGFIIKTEDAD